VSQRSGRRIAVALASVGATLFPASDYITAQTLPVDGGFTAK
jgi:NAD(P)-dependent dehydrogenase (short-subunit alcohol dehydrogenase family)